MKGIIVIILVLTILGGGGVMGYTYLKGQRSAGIPTKTKAVTLTGKLQAGKGDDYNYVLVAGGKLTGVASFNTDLGQYVGRVITIEGQYSGTTMYADSVKEGVAEPTKAK